MGAGKKCWTTSTSFSLGAGPALPLVSLSLVRPFLLRPPKQKTLGEQTLLTIPFLRRSLPLLPHTSSALDTDSFFRH